MVATSAQAISQNRTGKEISYRSRREEFALEKRFHVAWWSPILHCVEACGSIRQVYAEAFVLKVQSTTGCEENLFNFSTTLTKLIPLNFQSLPYQAEQAFSRNRNGRLGTSPVNVGTNPERSRPDRGKLDIRVDFKAPCSPNTAQLQSLMNLAAGLL